MPRFPLPSPKFVKATGAGYFLQIAGCLVLACIGIAMVKVGFSFQPRNPLLGLGGVVVMIIGFVLMFVAANRLRHRKS